VLLNDGIEWWEEHWRNWLIDAGFCGNKTCSLSRTQTGEMVGSVALTPGEIMQACVR
jgi:hypothetical protein